MKSIEKIKLGYRNLRDALSGLKERNVLCRILINKYAFVSLVFILWIVLFDNNSAGVLIRTNATIREQKEQIKSLKNEISSTGKRIEQLHSQKDTLERYAREEYLFHDKNETVFLIK